MLLILLSRPHNAPLFLLFELHQSFSYALPKEYRPLFQLLALKVSFFSLENSNSLSSLDLSNAYLGLSSYNPVFVGLLAFTSNWSGPLWWIFLAVERKEGLIPLWMIFEAWSTLFLSVSSTIMRHHLFIWTVFSPRYLYQVAWILVLGVAVAVNAFLVRNKAPV